MSDFNNGNYRIEFFLWKNEIIRRPNLRNEGFMRDLDVAVVSRVMPIVDHTTRFPPVVGGERPFAQDTTSLVAIVEGLQTIRSSCCSITDGFYTNPIQR